MLDKLTGVYAPRPRTGPHKLRECLPLQIVLRNRLKYALTGRECDLILHDKDNSVKIDNKVRTDKKFPVGLMDVLTIDKTGDKYRMLYDIKGRFTLVKLKQKESEFKLCKVKRREMGPNRIPYIVTHDARTIRFPAPGISVNDTIKLNLQDNTVEDHVKLEIGNNVLVTGGANRGRVGVIHNRTKHAGALDMICVKDSTGHTFNTRIGNTFVIGQGEKTLIGLPRGKGVKKNILEEQEARL